MSGYVRTAPQKAAASQKMKGNQNAAGTKRSPEHKEAIRRANLGNQHGLGYKHTPEAKEKIGKASEGNQYRVGKKLSPEHAEALRLSSLGNKGSLTRKTFARSPETRKKMSLASKGRQNTLGKHWKCSAETKERMRLAAILRRAKASEKAWASIDKKSGPIMYPKLGRCWYGGNEIKGHYRESWERVNGPVPKGLLVCHKCDNRPCIRPSHLFIGTHRDNSQDMKKKGRWKGGRPPKNKITF